MDLDIVQRACVISFRQIFWQHAPTSARIRPLSCHEFALERKVRIRRVGESLMQNAIEPVLESEESIDGTAMLPNSIEAKRTLFYDNLHQAIVAAVSIVFAVGVNWVLSKFVVSGGTWRGVLISFLLAQFAIAAVWLVMGKCWFAIRMLSPLFIAESNCWQFTHRVMPVTAEVTYFGFVVVGLLLLKTFGMILPFEMNSRVAFSPRQFSVRQLLLLTTCVAIWLAFANLHREDLKTRPGFGEVLLPCAVFATMALSGVYAALGPPKRKILRMILPLATASIVPIGFMQFASVPRWAFFIFFMQSFLVAVALIIWKYIWRSITKAVISFVRKEESSIDKPREQIPG